MDKNDAEKIINTFRAANEFYPTHDTFAMDGEMHSIQPIGSEAC
jgi:hypothetical protein